MKDALIIGAICIVAIVIGGWLFLIEPKGDEARSADIFVLAQGQQAYEVDERKNYRIRSLDELQELWSMTYPADGPAIPAVDFAQYEVLAVFDGTHTSGGYDVMVTGVEDSALSRTVRITRTSPGESCMTPSVITSPFVLVRIPASDLTIVREEESVVAECN